MERNVYDRMNDLEDRHWWFAARREVIAALVARYATKPGARILEAGCGSGGNLEMLGRYGQVDAFEYDDAARAHACAKSGLDIKSGALPAAVPFKGERYDLIGLFDVLEHIEADRETLGALADYLEDRGRLLVTVPAFPRLWSVHDDRHHHFRRYTRASLSEVAQAAGLRVRYASYFNMFLFPLAVATRLAKSVAKADTPDDMLPPGWLNGLLRGVFAAERHIVGRLRLPVGLSLVAVLEKA
jgi:SAM-dependent methyltransferase